MIERPRLTVEIGLGAEELSLRERPLYAVAHVVSVVKHTDGERIISVERFKAQASSLSVKGTAEILHHLANMLHTIPDPLGLMHLPEGVAEAIDKSSDQHSMIEILRHRHMTRYLPPNSLS